MRWISLGLPVLTLLAGCGYGAEKFEEDYTEALCRYEVQCFPAIWDDVDQCEAASSAPDVLDCPTYDATTARECVRALEELPCPQDDFVTLPSVCGEVCAGDDVDTDTDTDGDTDTDT